MPGQLTQLRQQQVMNYSLNGAVQSNCLSLGQHYRELHFRLAGNVLSGAGTNAYFSTASNLKYGDEWNYLQKIELVVNSNQVIRSITGPELFALNAFLYGRTTNPSSSFVGSNLTSSAFDSTLILPFWDFRYKSPLDTLLNSGALSDMRVNLTWGNPDSASYNVTGNSFGTAPAVTISSFESYGLKVAGMDPKFSVWKWFRMVNPSGTPNINSEYTIKLPLSDIYRGIWIHTESSTAGTDLESCISRVKLTSGPTSFVDIDAQTLREVDGLRQGRKFPMWDSTRVKMPLGASSNFKYGAWTYLDLCTDGYLSEGIDTLDMSELNLVLNITANIGNLIIIPDTIIPVRKRR